MYNPNNDADAPTVSLILPAAGDSTRMRASKRKPWLTLGGKPILFRTLELFHSLPWIEEIVLIVNEADEDEANGPMWEALSARGVSMVVTGGANRAESVWNGLQVSDPSCEVVAIHDAVRPFISLDTCKAIMRTARDRGACVPVVPMQDTVKRIEGDKVTETIRRLGLMAVQTPQCFRRELLIEAYEHARRTGGILENITDDASLVEAYGEPVSVVLGSSANLKITTQEDLVIAEAMLKAGVIQ